MDLLFQVPETERKLLADLFELGYIDFDACLLHGGQHGDEVTLERFVDGGHVFTDETGLKDLMQSQGHIGIFRSIFQGFFQGNLIKRDLSLSGTGDVLKFDRHMPQKVFGQFVHAMAMHAPF